MSRLRIVIFIGATAALAGFSWQKKPWQVGPVDTTANRYIQADASVTNGTGAIVTMKSRPVDLALSPSRRFAAVKDDSGVELVDLSSMKVVSRWKSGDGMSAIGIAFQNEDTIYATTAGKYLVEIKVGPDASLISSRRIDLGTSYPNGILIDGSKAYVALSTKNQLAEVDLNSGAVTRKLDIGIAPFGLALDPDRRELWVGEQGGVPPADNDLSATSAGTKVKVDERGIASNGAIGRIDLASWKLVSQTPIPTLPSSVVYDSDHKRIVVACANGDALVSVDPSNGATKLAPIKSNWFGAFPTGLCISGQHLYVTLAGLNQVLEMNWDRGKWTVGKSIDTDWFPVAVSDAGEKLAVANVKGLGARSPAHPNAYNTYDYTGSVRLVDKSAFGPWVREKVAGRGRYPAIKHVVYVIKENRTYDQLFGDIKSGEGAPSLVQYGQSITPNQHAIATTWVLLDNYYCSGVLSADGHSWATEGNSTPYLERSFGGFNRSYTFGDDPLTYTSSGFLWDPLIAKGLTFRNYGEFDYAESNTVKGLALYKKSLEGSLLSLKANIGVKRMRDYSCPGYPGWNLDISDQYRMDRFASDFAAIEKNGNMPALSIVYFPQDHTGGPVSPQAHIADNDLAVGRLIDTLSHSRFWKDTLVFVTEDDPQAGTDHIDGHRSICLVAGGMVKRNVVDHSFHTQASVLNTICGIFGLPPLNEKTAIAPPIDEIFRKETDLTPFNALRETIPLTQLPNPQGLYASTIKKLDLRRREVQTLKDMDSLNRALWAESRPTERYPVELAGAHGRGLAKMGLKLESGDRLQKQKRDDED